MEGSPSGKTELHCISASISIQYECIEVTGAACVWGVPEQKLELGISCWFPAAGFTCNKGGRLIGRRGETRNQLGEKDKPCIKSSREGSVDFLLGDLHEGFGKAKNSRSVREKIAVFTVILCQIYFSLSGKLYLYLANMPFMLAIRTRKMLLSTIHIVSLA